MFGMSAMSAAVEPLRGSPSFLNLLMTFSNPLLGFLAGAAFTAAIQSSAAFNQYYDEYRKNAI